MNLFSQLVDQKIIKILTVLLNSSQEHFHIQKLATKSKVPLSSTHRIVNKLVKIEIIEVIKINKFKIYILNEKKREELNKLVGQLK